MAEIFHTRREDLGDIIQGRLEERSRAMEHISASGESRPEASSLVNSHGQEP